MSKGRRTHVSCCIHTSGRWKSISRLLRGREITLSTELTQLLLLKIPSSTAGLMSSFCPGNTVLPNLEHNAFCGWQRFLVTVLVVLGAVLGSCLSPLSLQNNVLTDLQAKRKLESLWDRVLKLWLATYIPHYDSRFYPLLESIRITFEETHGSIPYRSHFKYVFLEVRRGGISFLKVI